MQQQASDNTIWRSYKNLTTFIEGYGKKHQAQYLVPLRLFIGLGWIRAAIEKLIDPHWHDGSKLLAFFDAQIMGGYVVFPAYQSLMEGVFTQQVVFMSWLVAVGQLLVGIGILTGTLTSVALIAAIFLNMNFMFAGRVNPSAFYLIIQMVLLQSKAGQFWGLDPWLSRRSRLLPIYPSYLRFSYNLKKRLNSKYGFIAQVALFGGACVAFVPFIKSINLSSCLAYLGLAAQSLTLGQPAPCVDLAHFIDDPAIFLSMLCAFTLLSTILRVFDRSKVQSL